MFRATYKNTIKNMLRSPTFWLMFVFLLGLGVYNAFKSSYATVIPETMEQISDLDPRWVFGYDTYIGHIRNAV